VFDIYSDLNDGETEGGRSSKTYGVVSLPGLERLSYKNTHKRVKKLNFLGLIEEVPEENRLRNEIKYRITTRGIIQCLLGYGNYGGVQFYLLFKDNIILQTLLYQYFNVETVEELGNMFGDYIFDDYLRRCCNQILSVVADDFDYWSTSVDFDYYKWKLIERTADRVNFPHSKASEYQPEIIEQHIKNELSSLLNNIVLMSTDPHYNDKFPNPAVIRDKKLGQVLMEMKNHLEKGFEKLLYLKRFT
jgi:hypothetical protein